MYNTMQCIIPLFQCSVDISITSGVSSVYFQIENLGLYLYPNQLQFNGFMLILTVKRQAL